MAKKSTVAKKKTDLTCFVVIGFGRKTDDATSRVLELDLTIGKAAADLIEDRQFGAGSDVEYPEIASSGDKDDRQ